MKVVKCSQESEWPVFHCDNIGCKLPFTVGLIGMVEETDTYWVAIPGKQAQGHFFCPHCGEKTKAEE